MPTTPPKNLTSDTRTQRIGWPLSKTSSTCEMPLPDASGASRRTIQTATRTQAATADTMTTPPIQEVGNRAPKERRRALAQSRPK